MYVACAKAQSATMVSRPVIGDRRARDLCIREIRVDSAAVFGGNIGDDFAASDRQMSGDGANRSALNAGRITGERAIFEREILAARYRAATSGRISARKS